MSNRTLTLIALVLVAATAFLIGALPMFFPH